MIPRPIGLASLSNDTSDLWHADLDSVALGFHGLMRS